MNASDLTERAYELVRDRGLARGHYALDDQGKACSALDQEAAQFCPIGALQHAAQQYNVPTWTRHGIFDQAMVRVGIAAEVVAGKPIVVTQWSDQASQEDVEEALLLASHLLPSRAERTPAHVSS